MYFMVRGVGERKLHISFSQILFDFDFECFLQLFSEGVVCKHDCETVFFFFVFWGLVTPNRNGVAFRSFLLMALKFLFLYCLVVFCFVFLFVFFFSLEKASNFLTWILQ